MIGAGERAGQRGVGAGGGAGGAPPASGQWIVAGDRALGHGAEHAAGGAALLPAAGSRGRGARGLGRITEDWYLTVFHPVTYWSLADVLHHFPRLCGISRDISK